MISVPSVLEPNFDLSFCKFKMIREFCSLCYGKILFLSELLLQGVQLLGGEGGPGLPVRFMFSQGTTEGPGGGFKSHV